MPSSTEWFITNKLQQDANKNVKDQCVSNNDLKATIDLLRADTMDLRAQHELKGDWDATTYSHTSINKNNKVQGQNLVHAVKSASTSNNFNALSCDE